VRRLRLQQLQREARNRAGHHCAPVSQRKRYGRRQIRVWPTGPPQRNGQAQIEQGRQHPLRRAHAGGAIEVGQAMASAHQAVGLRPAVARRGSSELVTLAAQTNLLNFPWAAPAFCSSWADATSNPEQFPTAARSRARHRRPLWSCHRAVFRRRYGLEHPAPAAQIFGCQLGCGLAVRNSVLLAIDRLRRPGSSQAADQPTRRIGRVIAFSPAANGPPHGMAIRRRRAWPPGRASASKCPPRPTKPHPISPVIATKAPARRQGRSTRGRIPGSGPNTASAVTLATAMPALERGATGSHRRDRRVFPGERTQLPGIQWILGRFPQQGSAPRRNDRAAQTRAWL